jgi:methionyl-tRNA formyltransferase
VFFGSGSFGVPILEALADAPGINLVGVISAPDRPSGRRGELTQVPVARSAAARGLRLVQPTRLRSPEGVAAVAELHPDFGVLADYGQIVPPSVLELPAHAIVNIHPSLLPRHRGAAPISATIAEGDTQAGVALMAMDEGLDTGPIVALDSWSLAGTETAETLESEAARRGADLLLRSLDDWLAGRIEAKPQAATGVTLTRPLRREDGRLDATRPARELERLVRAHVPWPGSFVDTNLGRLIIREADLRPSEIGDEPGAIVADGDGFALATADGRLRVQRAQLAGRRPMDGPSLRRGAPGLVGQRVELR